jgi:uncharacterized protein YabN with tetrapyrrole methylase and pyrophosphatase domain
MSSVRYQTSWCAATRTYSARCRSRPQTRSSSQELLRRAEAAGFAWPHRDDVLSKLHEEIAELADAPTPEAALDELGDILFNVVNYARYLGLDAEDALRAAGHKFRRRFGGVERLVASQGTETMKGMTREELMALWGQVKASEMPHE